MERGEIINSSSQAQKHFSDIAFLAFAVILSASPYVAKIGFYSDDWSALSRFRFSADQSIGGIFDFAYDDWVRMRPVQVLYQIFLYKAFDLNPLGHHLVNLLVILISTALCYATLRRVCGSRILGVSIALLYALLPHYSTDKLWYAAFQATLSMSLYLFCLYSQLRAQETSRAYGTYVWNIVGVVSLIVSGLSYELTIPLFLLNPLWCHVYRIQLGRRYSEAPLRRNESIWVMIHLLALAGVIGFKYYTTQRLVGGGLLEQLLWFGDFIVRSTIVAFGYLGVLLPWTALTVVSDHFQRVSFWPALLMAIVVFGYFVRLAKQCLPIDWKNALKLVVGGCVVFAAGYAIFLGQRNVSVGVITGIGNRVSIGAAWGVAISLVGAIACLSGVLTKEIWRRQVFAGLMAMFCLSGFIVNNAIADFWVEAYRREKDVLDRIRQALPVLPRAGGLIVDNICPYVGPGVVFESDWDLAGALRILYGDPEITAQVIVPDIKVTNEGLVSNIYGYESKFLYGDKLQIFDVKSGQYRQLINNQAVCDYFSHKKGEPGGGCPNGQPGYGVPILRYRELPLTAEQSSVLVRSLKQTCGPCGRRQNLDYAQ